MNICAKVGNNNIWESNTVKLLGVTIDNQLKFNEHVLNICKKASRKLSALSRMSSFLSFDKKRIIFKAFFESQFKYCPLVWMFHGREVNQRINRLHERALRIVYNVSTFEHLLEKYYSCTVHHSNLHFLSIELYKVVNDQSTNIFLIYFSVIIEGSASVHRMILLFLKLGLNLVEKAHCVIWDH